MNVKNIQKKKWVDRLKSSLLISLILVGVWLVIALVAGGKSSFSTAEGIDRNGREQVFRMIYDPENRIVAALNLNTGEFFDPSAGDIFLVRSDGLQSITITSDGKNHRFDIDRRSLGQHVWNDMILDPLGFDGHYGSGYGFLRSLGMSPAGAAIAIGLTGNAFWIFVVFSVVIFIVRK